MLKKVSLSKQIDKSTLVLEGKVLSKKSFWDTKHQKIYTINTIEVFKVFKGEVLPKIEIITLGGVIGMLIVDPATGAMYKLDTEFLNETLSKSTASIGKTELKIYGINEIPSVWTEHLVIVSK